MESILEVIKLELELELDQSKDDLLKKYIIRSCSRIRIYLNREINDEYILDNYQDAVIELTCNIYRNKKLKNTSNGIKSIKEGDISITYEDSKNSGITKDIQELLPLPCISMY